MIRMSIKWLIGSRRKNAESWIMFAELVRNNFIKHRHKQILDEGCGACIQVHV